MLTGFLYRTVPDGLTRLSSHPDCDITSRQSLTVRSLDPVFSAIRSGVMVLPPLIHWFSAVRHISSLVVALVMKICSCATLNLFGVSGVGGSLSMWP